MLVGAVCVLAPIEGGRYVLQRQRDRAAAAEAASLRRAEPQLLAPLACESLEGLLLATQETPVPGKAKPLERRAGCLWGVPGRNPYKGTVRQVLAGAKVPEEVIGKIDSMVVRGRKTGRVEITNRGIWTEDGRRHFRHQPGGHGGLKRRGGLIFEKRSTRSKPMRACLKISVPSTVFVTYMPPCSHLLAKWTCTRYKNS